MDKLGERLVEERVRLGFTQADFGRLGGVGRTTQLRYESGETSPAADYLLALVPHGFDMLYVLTGQRGVDTVGLMTSEESALVENYRAASPDHQASLRAVGASFAEQDKRSGQAKKASNQ